MTSTPKFQKHVHTRQNDLFVLGMENNYNGDSYLQIRTLYVLHISCAAFDQHIGFKYQKVYINTWCIHRCKQCKMFSSNSGNLGKVFLPNTNFALFYVLLFILVHVIHSFCFFPTGTSRRCG